MSKKQLILNIGKYFGTETSVKIIKWLFTLILGVVLDPYVFGIIGIIKIFEDMLPSILVYGQNSTLQRFYYEADSNDRGVILYNCSFIVIFFNAFIFIILTICYLIFKIDFLAGIDSKIYGILVCSSILFLPFKILLFTYFRVIKNIKNFFRYNLYYEIGRIIIFLIIYLILNNALKSYILSLFLINFIIVYFIFSNVKFQKFNKEKIIHFAKFGFPLVFMSLSATFFLYIIRFIIGAKLSLDYVGYFTLCFTILQIIPFLFKSINLAAEPYFFELLAESPNQSEYFLKTFTNINILIAIICSATIFILSNNAEIISININSNVLKIMPFIICYFIISPINYFQNIVMMKNFKQNAIAIINVIFLGVSIILAYYFIEKYQFIGVGYAIVLSYLFRLLLPYFIKIEKYVPDKYAIISLPLILILFINFKLWINLTVYLSLIFITIKGIFNNLEISPRIIYRYIANKFK
jgi:O-antigen/teichoic acid export membrane protein